MTFKASLLTTTAPRTRSGAPMPSPKPLPRPALLNEFEVAALLHFDIGTIRRFRWMTLKCGRWVGPKWLKFGRNVRYDPLDVEAYIAAGRVKVEGSEVGG
jgi:hypothetical protein